MMDLQARYEAALAFTREKHKNQYRIGGEEYVTHPIGVAEIVRSQGYGIDYQLTALFHDMLEDTDATEAEILYYGNKDILDAVKILTKTKGYVMEEYIDGIKNNPLAYVVKAADRLHNLRSALVTDNEFKRKYVVETINWYLDFSEWISYALAELVMSMEPVWKNRMSFVWCLKANAKVMMEGDLRERLHQEYYLDFNEKVGLSTLVYKEPGREALKSLWKEYAKIAENHHYPFLAMTPTKRLNQERTEGFYYPEGIIIDNVAHLKRVREECNCEMYVGAHIGRKEDQEIDVMSVESYQEFHEWEIEQFVRAGVEFLYASSIANINEAIGIAKEISITKVPYILSFEVNGDGCLPDGTSIAEAIECIDKSAKIKPAFYMSNGVPIDEIISALQMPFNQVELVKRRFLGTQANVVLESKPIEFAESMKKLNEIQTMKVFGGGKGTDYRYMEAIADII